MKLEFIPINYDYFDFDGKNYVKIIGRDSTGKVVCLIDSCPVYLWAILEDKISQTNINKLIKEISNIKLNLKGRQTKVEKIELHNKNFLGKPVKALKIFATNYKDLHNIADKLNLSGIKLRRGYDLGFTTHYIIEKDLKPLHWYSVEGEILHKSNEFGGIDNILEVDLCIKVEKTKQIKEKKFTPKTIAYDIETDEIQIGKGEILMISLVGSDGLKKVITWKGNKNNKHFQVLKGKSAMEKKCLNSMPFSSRCLENFSSEIRRKNTMEKGCVNSTQFSSRCLENCPSEIRGRSTRKTGGVLVYVENEAELLKEFIKIVKQNSPDFLVGYHSDGFDLPYIKERAKIHKIKLSLGLDGSQPKFSRSSSGLTGKIQGITHIDLLKFIKTAYAQYMKSETLSLDEVAKEFLGDSKKEFKFKHSSQIKDEEWLKYYEYNLHDSVLTLKLFDKFWPDLLEFTKSIQEPLFDISRAGLSKYTESYILHNLNRFNEIPEKRPTYAEISERKHSGGVEGAYVLQPTPGLYENLAMFDFTSMHTSIIITHNISKSTLLPKKERGAIESPELELKGKKQKFYFSTKSGFFPELLKETFEKRKQFKKEYKKNPNPITLARSNAFKVLSASAHGYLGFFGARYYSLEASASVLAFVRKFNKETIKKIEKKGYNVIYGDTDSIAFQINNQSETKIKNLLKTLNSELPGVMHLELEGFFKRGLWVTTRAGTFGAKKKYALLNKNGEIKIRGFETVRRDWCQLSRKLQDKIIRLILEDGNEKRAIKEIKKTIKKIKNREINKEDLIIKTQLKKPLLEYKANTPHIVAAKKMIDQKIPVSQGNLIKYYIADTKNKKLIRDKVKLPHEEAPYDIKYYLERQIISAVENILQVFDINAKELIENKKQTTLGDF